MPAFSRLLVYREMDWRPAAALVDTGQAHRRSAVLRRHGQRLRLAARLLPDPERSWLACPHGAWDRVGTGFFIAFVFLVVGCFLDAIPAIIIVGTILEPLAQARGSTRCTSP